MGGMMANISTPIFLSPTTEDLDFDYEPQQADLSRSPFFDPRTVKVIELAPGTQVQKPGNPLPGVGVEQSIQKLAMLISAQLGVHYSQLFGDISIANYSSLRSAETIARDNFRNLQELLANQFLTPLYEDWLMWYLENVSFLPIEGFSRFVSHRWQYRRYEYIDPAKQARAEEFELKNHLTSHKRLAEERGADLQTILDEEKEYRQLLEDRDLLLNDEGSQDG